MFGTWGSSVNSIFTLREKAESRIEAASTFLSTGIQYTAIGGTSCNGSYDCASGFFCNSNGVCEALNSSTSNGNSCGSDNSPDRGTCSSGNCTTSGCSPKADCCGPRYCRYSAGPLGVPSVYCQCGYPPKQGTCTTFCTSYYATTGEINGGCTKDQICDECSYCDDGLCVESQSYIPCHCSGSGTYSLPACTKCNENGTVVAAPETCSSCCPVSNYQCSCGKTISSTCCYTQEQLRLYGEVYTTACEKCYSELQAKCAKACAPTLDTICGKTKDECTEKTRTYDGPCYCRTDYNPETQTNKITCPGTNTCDAGEIANITGFIESQGTNVSTPWSQIQSGPIENVWGYPAQLRIAQWRAADVYITKTEVVNLGQPPVTYTVPYYQESRPGTYIGPFESSITNSATGYRIVPYVSANASFGTARPVDLPITYYQLRDSNGNWTLPIGTNSAPTYYGTPGYPVSFSGYIQSYPTSITIDGVEQPLPVLAVGTRCTVFYNCCGTDADTSCKSDADCPLGYKCGSPSAQNCTGCYKDPLSRCTLPAIGPDQRWMVQVQCPWSAYGCFVQCFCTLMCEYQPQNPSDPNYYTCYISNNIYWNTGFYNPRVGIILLTAYYPPGQNFSNCFPVMLGEGTVMSDRRLKFIIEKQESSINKILQLIPRRFTSNDKSVDGFLPEEVENISPQAVIGEKQVVDGQEAYRFVHDAMLVPLLTASLQELYERIEVLKKRIASM